MNAIGDKLGAQALMILGSTVMKLKGCMRYPFRGKEGAGGGTGDAR